MLFEAWRTHSLAALESMTGGQARVEQFEQEAPGADDLVWREYQLQVKQPVSIWIGLPRAVRQALGAEVLSAAGVEEPSPEDSEGTVDEILGMCISGIARSLSASLTFEVTSVAAGDSAPPDPTAHTFRFILGEREFAPVAVVFSQLAQALEDSRAVASAPDTALAASQSEDPPAPSQSYSGTMDLLLEVELPVSVSFGRAHLPLKDVIKLTTGSIVELNRSLTEPVEVIVNNCVIARGEVVVIEGNYGVRIHEIISRRERLRTLD